MKKIEFINLDASVYYEKLPNELEVYLIPYSNKNNYFMSYGTWFGSLNTEFVPVGSSKMRKVPDGIAHFLEHKMFEQEDGIDPFTFYAKSGTGANASTSFDSTRYICYGTKNFNENLSYLLNYVNEPYFTDENVEKEKGIIGEEIKMYDDIPEWVLEDELRRNLYHKHPMRIDIAGTVEDINQITKEDLYDCYHTFYHPTNMFLIVAGNFDPEEIMQLVRENQEKRTFPSATLIKQKDYKEPFEVCKKETTLYMNVAVPKVGVGFKFDRDKIKFKEDALVDMYLTMIMSLLFGVTSEFREKARNQKWMTSFYTQWERADHFRDFLIIAESVQPEELLKAIKEEVSHIQIQEADVERMKKVWIASEVQMIDNVETTVDNLFDDLIKYKKILPNKTELIRSLNKKELDSVMKQLDFHNMTTTILYPQEQK